MSLSIGTLIGQVFAAAVLLVGLVLALRVLKRIGDRSTDRQETPQASDRDAE